jgi:MFS family permease
MTAPSRGRFRSLRNANYRIWAGGALVSNIGTWMQRIAQDWLVLTQLTAHNATAVGVVMALQYGPHLVLLPFTGYAADLFDRRKLLLATQFGMGVLAASLGVLTITGAIQLWEVYVMALVQGCITAFDAPARQSFVSELVGEADLSNAVALNSTSFNAARMIGPAAAGLIIAAVGCGWAFLINAASFVAVLGSLTLLRVDDLHRSARAIHTRGGLVDGFRYVWRRDDLKTILVMLFLVGTFGMNFPIFISTMSVSVFHAGAGEYGLLMSIMAIGTIAGALLAAGQETPRFVRLVAGAAFFGLGCGLAAVTPGYWLFGGTLVIIGVSALTFSNSTNSLMQLATEPAMRGRVMAMRLAVALGGTPIGAPIVGWVADHFGPRWSLGVGAAAGLAAALVGLFYVLRRRSEGRAVPPGSSSSKDANGAATAANEIEAALANSPITGA